MTLLHLLSFIAVFASSMLSAQNVSFTQDTYSYGNILAHADFNNDGREDFVSYGRENGQFGVVLSAGDGVYEGPSFYTLPSGNPNLFAIGDFNRDGNVDLVVSNGNTLYEYLNNGNGTFRLHASLKKYELF